MPYPPTSPEESAEYDRLAAGGHRYWLGQEPVPAQTVAGPAPWPLDPQVAHEGFNNNNNNSGPVTPTHQRADQGGSTRSSSTINDGSLHHQPGPNHANFFDNGGGFAMMAPVPTPPGQPGPAYLPPNAYHHGGGFNFTQAPAPTPPGQPPINANNFQQGGPFGDNPFQQQGPGFGFGGGGGGAGSLFGSNANPNVNDAAALGAGHGFPHGEAHDNSNNLAVNRHEYDYVLTSSHPVEFHLLPQENAYSVTNQRLAILTHPHANITYTPVREQPVDATQYQYVLRGSRVISHLTSNNTLQSMKPFSVQVREGALNYLAPARPSAPPPRWRAPSHRSRPRARAPSVSYAPIIPPAANTQPAAPSPAHTEAPPTTPAAPAPGGPVDAAPASGSSTAPPKAKRKTKRKAKGEPEPEHEPKPKSKPKKKDWTENEITRPIWDAAKGTGEMRRQEDGLAPTHYECKLCLPRPNSQGELVPFRGREGEQRRHFSTGREGHMEAWNRVMGENLERFQCQFPVIDPATGRAAVDEGGAARTCSFSHGRVDHVWKDHMASVHNAEAPGDPRAHTTEIAYLGRKQVAQRRAIVETELEALTAFRQRIRRLEEELAARFRGTNTPYVSVHGLDLSTNWQFDEGEASPAAIARLRRLADATGRRQFRSELPGSWHQVADDLEAGLRPGSTLAQALDFASQSQRPADEGGHRFWDFDASQPELGDAGMVPLAPEAPGQQPARKRRKASQAEPKPKAKAKGKGKGKGKEKRKGGDDADDAAADEDNDDE